MRNEQDLNMPSLTSTSALAKLFKHWVTANVLPQIRKTGSPKHGASMGKNMSGNFFPIIANRDSA
ncbi:MAG: hypothetical protein K5683_04240 [Prevotella sp.]|nr:hypothetical protein [Prevotella sp.]